MPSSRHNDTPCPNRFPPGFYQYDNRRRSPGHPPKWVQKLLLQDVNELEAGQNESDEAAAKNIFRPEPTCICRSVTLDCEVESEEEMDPGTSSCHCNSKI